MSISISRTTVLICPGSKFWVFFTSQVVFCRGIPLGFCIVEVCQIIQAWGDSRGVSSAPVRRAWPLELRPYLILQWGDTEKWPRVWATQKKDNSRLVQVCGRQSMLYEV